MTRAEMLQEMLDKNPELRGSLFYFAILGDFEFEQNYYKIMNIQ